MGERISCVFYEQNPYRAYYPDLLLHLKNVGWIFHDKTWLTIFDS